MQVKQNGVTVWMQSGRLLLPLPPLPILASLPPSLAVEQSLL
jgi:hypothetical protein